MLFYDKNGKLKEVSYADCLSERHFYSTLCLTKFGPWENKDGTSGYDLLGIINRYRQGKSGTRTDPR